MNCSNCGQPVDQGAVFCGNCGQQVTAPPPPPAQTATTAVQPTTQPPVSQPGQPTVSAGAPIAPQPTANQPATAIPPPQPVQPAAPAAPGAIPAYATTAKKAKTPGEKKAIIGLIFSVCSVPGAIVPVIAMVFGVAGVVLASLSVRLFRAIAIVSFVFAGIGIVLGLSGWVYLIKNDDPASHLSKQTRLVSTDCYKIKLSTSLRVTERDSSKCRLDARDKKSNDASIAYVISGIYQPDMNSDNFASASKKGQGEFVDAFNSKSDHPYKIEDQHLGKFKSDRARYFRLRTAGTNKNAEIAIVFHDGSGYANTFLVASVVSHGKASLSQLESNWQWQ